MNPYLSREEKAHFIRVTALIQLMEEVIEGYCGAKSTDPTFLRYMRTGKTFMEKAMVLRASFLEKDAKAEFEKQAGRLEFLCLPTTDAKKAHAELLALQTTLPMELKDFEDWYGDVIESTCKSCTREEFGDCQIRRVLTKYGVYAIDPSATTKCQYSYVGTLNAEELQAETDAKAVPAAKYNQAVAELNAANARCDEIKMKMRDSAPASEMEELSTKYRELAEDFDSLTVKTQTEYLPQIRAMNERIVAMEAANAAVADAVLNHDKAKEKLVEALAALIRKPETPKNEKVDIVKESPAQEQQYRIECKCGAAYYCQMNHGRTTAGCRTCSLPVYADLTQKRNNPFGTGDVVLLTNRGIAKPQAKPVRQFGGRNYSDPIEICGGDPA